MPENMIIINGEALVIIMIILTTTIFDAMRDAWASRLAGISWWQWHGVKWIAFYLPLLFLSCRFFVVCGWKLVFIIFFAGLGLVCWALWRFVYKQLIDSKRNGEQGK